MSVRYKHQNAPSLTWDDHAHWEAMVWHQPAVVLLVCHQHVVGVIQGVVQGERCAWEEGRGRGGGGGPAEECLSEAESALQLSIATERSMGEMPCVSSGT